MRQDVAAGADIGAERDVVLRPQVDFAAAARERPVGALREVAGAAQTRRDDKVATPVGRDRVVDHDILVRREAHVAVVGGLHRPADGEIARARRGAGPAREVEVLARTDGRQIGATARIEQIEIGAGIRRGAAARAGERAAAPDFERVRRAAARAADAVAGMERHVAAGGEVERTARARVGAAAKIACEGVQNVVARRHGD